MMRWSIQCMHLQRVAVREEQHRRAGQLGLALPHQLHRARKRWESSVDSVL